MLIKLIIHSCSQKLFLPAGTPSAYRLYCYRFTQASNGPIISFVCKILPLIFINSMLASDCIKPSIDSEAEKSCIVLDGRCDEIHCHV